MLSRKVIIGKNKQAPYVPGGFKIQISLANNGDKFTLPLVNPNYLGAGNHYDFDVIWGDGSSNHITDAYDSNIVHTYQAGTYDIEIKGRCDGWSAPNKTAITKILSWGNDDFEGFTWLRYGFQGCTNLVELPINQSIKERLPIGDIYCLFEYCPISTIPNGLFDKLNVGSFYNCFIDCHSLTSIPSGLFEKNVDATSFQSCFRNCNKLQLIPNIFNYSNFLNKTIDFSRCFYRTSFTGNQGIAPDLWNADFGTGVPTTTGCFGGAGNSLTSITNYADIPAAWK